jgi:hypothetical protein
MLRFLAPYLVPIAALTIVAMALYDASVINAAGVYGLMIIACIIGAVGYTRWDFHKYPDDSR